MLQEAKGALGLLRLGHRKGRPGFRRRGGRSNLQRLFRQGPEEGANIEYAYPKQGFVIWMDNVVLLKDAPNRAAALKFMNFLLEPENAAAVTNFAQYTAGVKNVAPLLSQSLRESPEANPPADAPAGTFIEVCDEQTQVDLRCDLDPLEEIAAVAVSRGCFSIGPRETGPTRSPCRHPEGQATES